MSGEIILRDAHAEYDVGWNGIAMAKTYLEVHPNTQLVMLDASESIGGVWSQNRLYPGLKSNNLHGTYQFSDFPMDPETFGVKPGEHIPGTVVHKYLTMYAERHDILRRIRFNRQVKSVERKEDGGWLVTSSKTDNGADAQNGKAETESILARKLVIATGLTSQPFIPKFKGSESFDAPIFHAKELHKRAGETVREGNNVIVFGGSKSGFDAAYAHVSQGATVDWIIRKSGTGPVWMAPAYVTPLKQRFEKLVGIRFLTWLSPCIWGDNDGFSRVRRLLHNTKIGRWIVDSFWSILSNDVLAANNYEQHPEVLKLKPWTPAFWTACSLSLLNYPTDFFQYVREGKIRVHIEDIDHLSEKTVHLSNDTAVHGNALICATGWKHRPVIEFLPNGIDAQLGVPHDQDLEDDTRTEKADNLILERFPRLRAQPPIEKGRRRALEGNESDAVMSRPYRLYRFMVPPAYINDRSIAFAGVIMSIHTVMCAQIQALWLTAYFSGQLLSDLPSPSQYPIEKANGHATRGQIFDEEDVQWQAILNSQFGKWRYPAGMGKRFPDFVFDAMPYVDGLLQDLGLRFRRKGGWLRELFEPYGVDDYKGLVGEWKRFVGL